MTPAFDPRPEAPAGATPALPSEISLADAESVLNQLAAVFFQKPNGVPHPEPHADARYRALVEQIPAVVFMAYLDRGIGEAYISPQIEATLGFSQKEWLEDPVRWYQQIHPDDKQRWSLEAAHMFLSGEPLKSSYRVITRAGRVMWFHCEAKMVRQQDGRPWFIHGAAFDITDLKRAEAALQEERNVAAVILNTVGALVVVLEPNGSIVRFNRACEQTTGYSFNEVQGRRIRDLFLAPEEIQRFAVIFEQLQAGQAVSEYETHWVTRDGGRRLISWTSTLLHGSDGAVQYVIATGIDITERTRLEKTILEISGREQRRIGQDLHDGLGQHLTGIAFLSKVLEQQLAEAARPEANEAAKIVRLVNEAIKTARELARGLLPVLSHSNGLMSALEQWALEVEHVFRVSCRFRCDEPVLIDDETVATHLYHIAQESVHNAIKHGHAKRVSIGLSERNGGGRLVIEDDGCGIGQPRENHGGMGLHIMSYRAKMIGGSLVIRKGTAGGTTVHCLFPTANREEGP